MGFLTESKLANVIDMPISLPTTEIKQGDWLVIASVKITTPQRLLMRFLNLKLVSATVDVADISSVNKVFGNLGLAYVALRRDYQSGSPGVAGGLEILQVEEIGLVERPTTQAVYATPGIYSWIIANNMQPDDASDIPTSTEINFRLAATGQVRLELDNV